MKRLFLPALTLAAASAAHAGITLTPLTTFGGTDGWRAPGEIVPGDAAGTNNGTTYNYLGTANNERGMAYSAADDRLLLVSRTGGLFIRLLDPLTGQDYAGIATTGISGGTFAASHIAAAPDGMIYAANLTTNATTSAFKVYRWDNISAEPVVYFNATVAGFSAAARLGDSFDLVANGGVHTLVAGAAGVVGYLLIPEGNTSVSIGSFTPAGPVASDFRPGVTFGPAGEGEVWGKAQNGAFRRTTYAGGTGAYAGSGTLAGTAEGAMDVTTVDGVPLLATMEANTAGGAGRPTVRVYDVSTPSSPALAASGTTASGTLATNGNAAGTVKWGAVSGNTAQLYAMATNQGIQAFTVTVTPDIVPPAISTSPVGRTVYDRGQTTFTVSATGTPPFTYQWYKDSEPVGGATAASYTINPVDSSLAGSYVCRVTNAGGFAESTPATLTVAASVNTAALTQCWTLPPGARPWLTATGDTERGLDYHPGNNHLYIVSRSPSPQIYVLDGTTGADLNTLDLTGVSGGNFVLMFPCIADDGAIFACNLSNTGDGSSFKIYRWADDSAVTLPTTAYDGNPIGTRIGDSFDLRGAGANTEAVAGARNTNQIVIFKPDGAGGLTPFPVAVSGAANGAFGLGVAFGAGKTVWGKNGGGNLVYCSYDETAGTGTVLASYGPSAGVPGSAGPLGVDPVNHCLALIEIGNSDNVRFFSYTGDTPVLTLLDQEFFPADNPNLNNVGSVSVGAGKVYTLDTNNGLACYSTLKPAAPVLGPITRNPDATFSFQLTGTPGFNYVVEGSNDLTPASWGAVAVVPFTQPVQTVTLPMSASRAFYRSRLGP